MPITAYGLGTWHCVSGKNQSKAVELTASIRVQSRFNGKIKICLFCGKTCALAIVLFSHFFIISPNNAIYIREEVAVCNRNVNFR